MKRKNGFTLIELLAVIIILGILMIIAIPSVTEYITNSRKNAFVTTMNGYVDEVRNKLNALEYKPSPGYNEAILVPLSTISLEKGGKSPFGDWVSEKSYIVAVFKDKGYEYYVTALDTAGYNVGAVNINDLTVDDVSSDIKEIRSITEINANNVIVVDSGAYKKLSGTEYIILSKFGTAVADLSGNGNTGTMVNATYDSSKQAIKFYTNPVNVDASNYTSYENASYVNAGYSNYDFGTNVSFVARVNFSSADRYQEILGNWDNAGGGLALSTNQKPNVKWYINGVYVQVTSSININLNTWYTIVGTYDGSEIKLFINGSKVGNLSQSGNVKKSSMPIFIGANPNANSVLAQSDCLFKETMVFNRALSDSEITNNYSSTINVTDNTGLLFHYKFD